MQWWYCGRSYKICSDQFPPDNKIADKSRQLPTVSSASPTPTSTYWVVCSARTHTPALSVCLPDWSRMVDRQTHTHTDGDRRRRLHTRIYAGTHRLTRTHRSRAALDWSTHAHIRNAGQTPSRMDTHTDIHSRCDTNTRTLIRGEQTDEMKRKSMAVQNADENHLQVKSTVPPHLTSPAPTCSLSLLV